MKKEDLKKRYKQVFTSKNNRMAIFEMAQTTINTALVANSLDCIFTAVAAYSEFVAEHEFPETNGKKNFSGLHEICLTYKDNANVIDLIADKFSALSVFKKGREDDIFKTLWQAKTSNKGLDDIIFYRYVSRIFAMRNDPELQNAFKYLNDATTMILYACQGMLRFKPESKKKQNQEVLKDSLEKCLAVTIGAYVQSQNKDSKTTLKELCRTIFSCNIMDSEEKERVFKIISSPSNLHNAIGELEPKDGNFKYKLSPPKSFDYNQITHEPPQPISSEHETTNNQLESIRTQLETFNEVKDEHTLIEKLINILSEIKKIKNNEGKNFRYSIAIDKEYIDGLKQKISEFEHLPSQEVGQEKTKAAKGMLEKEKGKKKQLEADINRLDKYITDVLTSLRLIAQMRCETYLGGFESADFCSVLLKNQQIFRDEISRAIWLLGKTAEFIEPDAEKENTKVGNIVNTLQQRLAERIIKNGHEVPARLLEILNSEYQSQQLKIEEKKNEDEVLEDKALKEPASTIAFSILLKKCAKPGKKDNSIDKRTKLAEETLKSIPQDKKSTADIFAATISENLTNFGLSDFPAKNKIDQVIVTTLKHTIRALLQNISSAMGSREKDLFYAHSMQNLLKLFISKDHSNLTFEQKLAELIAGEPPIFSSAEIDRLIVVIFDTNSENFALQPSDQNHSFGINRVLSEAAVKEDAEKLRKRCISACLAKQINYQHTLKEFDEYENLLQLDCAFTGYISILFSPIIAADTTLKFIMAAYIIAKYAKQYRSLTQGTGQHYAGILRAFRTTTRFFTENQQKNPIYGVIKHIALKASVVSKSIDQLTKNKVISDFKKSVINANSISEISFTNLPFAPHILLNLYEAINDAIESYQALTDDSLTELLQTFIGQQLAYETDNYPQALEIAQTQNDDLRRDTRTDKYYLQLVNITNYGKAANGKPAEILYKLFLKDDIITNYINLLSNQKIDLLQEDKPIDLFNECLFAKAIKRMLDQHVEDSKEQNVDHEQNLQSFVTIILSSLETKKSSDKLNANQYLLIQQLIAIAYLDPSQNYILTTIVRRENLQNEFPQICANIFAEADTSPIVNINQYLQKQEEKETLDRFTLLSLAIADDKLDAARIICSEIPQENLSDDQIKAINNKEYNSKTPLILACEKDDPWLVENLIRRGADQSIPDTEGHLPMWHALNSEKVELLTELAKDKNSERVRTAANNAKVKTLAKKKAATNHQLILKLINIGARFTVDELKLMEVSDNEVIAITATQKTYELVSASSVNPNSKDYTYAVVGEINCFNIATDVIDIACTKQDTTRIKEDEYNLFTFKLKLSHILAKFIVNNELHKKDIPEAMEIIRKVLISKKTLTFEPRISIQYQTKLTIKPLDTSDNTLLDELKSAWEQRQEKTSQKFNFDNFNAMFEQNKSSINDEITRLETRKNKDDTETYNTSIFITHSTSKTKIMDFEQFFNKNNSQLSDDDKRRIKDKIKELYTEIDTRLSQNVETLESIKLNLQQKINEIKPGIGEFEMQIANAKNETDEMSLRGKKDALLGEIKIRENRIKLLDDEITRLQEKEEAAKSTTSSLQIT